MAIWQLSSSAFFCALKALLRIKPYKKRRVTKDQHKNKRHKNNLLISPYLLSLQTIVSKAVCEVIFRHSRKANFKLRKSYVFCHLPTNRYFLVVREAV